VWGTARRGCQKCVSSCPETGHQRLVEESATSGVREREQPAPGTWSQREVPANGSNLASVSRVLGSPAVNTTVGVRMYRPATNDVHRQLSAVGVGRCGVWWEWVRFVVSGCGGCGGSFHHAPAVNKPCGKPSSQNRWESPVNLNAPHSVSSSCAVAESVAVQL